MSAKGNSRGRRRLGLLAATVASAALAVGGSSALGASVSTAAFGGGSGTVSVGGTLFAKNGGALTLNVTTSSDAKCVQVTGAQTARQTDNNGRTTWAFSFTAGSGDGVQTVTVAASDKFNANGCTGQSQSPQTASYVLDNTGPTVAAALSAAPNAAGWNNGNVDLTWSATDVGSGVSGSPTPATDSVKTNTAGVTKTATAADRLGNQGSGSVTVKLDKTAPTVSGSRSPSANANGWNNGDVTVSVTCADALAGIKSCTGGGTQVLSGEGAGQSVTASAVDAADNSAATTVGPINIDKTAPSLSGAIADGTAGDNGWYTSDVTIHWSCSDALSGIDGGCPGDRTIAGEGQVLTTTASVLDRAGNERVADGPTVKIDKTAPNTDASAVDTWNNVDVSVQLTANDALSGVDATHYRVDGGSVQTGAQVSLSDEGVHSLEYWSVDRAGNVESHKSVDVRIDKSSPTIRHELSPEANANGWFKDDVDVRFICADALSGIKSCGPDRVVSSEGANQDESGTAVDNAGNRALDPATVSLDRTPPTIAASTDRKPNADGWYDGDVTVSFACADALSGVDTCPAPKTLGEGANQSAGGTVADAAGNTASDGVEGIDVDKTPPALSGAATTLPNGSGWYRDDVVVAWTCADELSGLAGDCPAAATVTGEGGNLSAGGSVSDRAGNTTHETVDGIRIDRTAPSTSIDVPAPLASGWYAGPVKVTLTGVDGLSGVERTYYRVDGGDAQAYDGAFDFAAKGVHTLTYWSVDAAGNVEDRAAPGHTLELKLDGVPPRISASRLPAANAFGWSNQPVTVSFECADDESGIAGCSAPLTLTNEGAGQSAVGSAQDNAGNSSTAEVDDVNIDLTAPQLAGAATTDANAAGWYRDDVTIHWTAADGLSGIDPATVPADTVVTGEGADLATGQVSVADKAGNATSSSVDGLKIDRTPPAIVGAPATRPNDDGWYGGDVVVKFSCTDNLSGVASCPSDKLVSGNGAGQSVTSAPAADLAGNVSPGATVGDLNIDGLPPQTVADNQCTRSNGWCTGSTATVVLTATDQAGLSGVKEIHYRVGDGAEQVAAGASATIDVPLDGTGQAGVTFYAVDRAGNREPDNGVSLTYDNIAPTVTHTLAPAPNANEWSRDDVTVHFSATDDAGGSGVDDARTTPDVSVHDETAGLAVAGEAYDLAGNRGADSATVRLDRTPPSIQAAVVSGQLGDNGWYVGPVRVHFTCSDGLSKVAICPDDVTLTADGAGQTVTGEAIDFAGNRATATVRGIDIDHERPSLTVTGIADGAIYTLGAVPTPACAATDGVSGSAVCSVAVTGGQANGVGTFAFTATAHDRAGNTQTATGSYRVVYRFDGFLQPINDTAHQVGVATSVFKAGSTVPVKLQLKRADGSVVEASAAPLWELPVKGGPTTAPVDDAVYGAAADTMTAYRWDGTARQYQYNWGTEAAAKGYYHRIGVRLDDGQTYFVNIGLR